MWKFRAARRERLIVVRGRVESTWPVDGGVLVEAGLVYFASGRHGTLDGGVDVYALRPATGELVWTRHETNTPVISLMASNGKSVSVGGKTAYALETGEDASRPDFGEDVYRADMISLTQRIGHKNEDPRMQPQLSIQAVAVVRSGDTILVAGKLGDQPPLLQWVHQRNGTVINNDAPPRGDQGPFYLWAFSANDGKLQWTQPLPAAPLFDSLAVADGSIYLTTTDQQLLAFGSPPQ